MKKSTSIEQEGWTTQFIAYNTACAIVGRAFQVHWYPIIYGTSVIFTTTPTNSFTRNPTPHTTTHQRGGRGGGGVIQLNRRGSQ